MDEAASAFAWKLIQNQKKWINWNVALIQLKIEREALKKENDEASKKRLNNLEDRH